MTSLSALIPEYSFIFYLKFFHFLNLVSHQQAPMGSYFIVSYNKDFVLKKLLVQGYIKG